MKEISIADGEVTIKWPGEDPPTPEEIRALEEAIKDEIHRLRIPTTEEMTESLRKTMKQLGIPITNTQNK